MVVFIDDFDGETEVMTDGGEEFKKRTANEQEQCCYKVKGASRESAYKCNASGEILIRGCYQLMTNLNAQGVSVPRSKANASRSSYM